MIKETITQKRQAINDWADYRSNLLRATPVPVESKKEQEARIKELQKDPFAFFKFYFPNYCDAEFAPFQKRFVNKVLEEKKLYITLEVAREHAKSVITSLFLPVYLMFGRKEKLNMILASHSYDNALELLRPLIINLEDNQRIVNDYGQQKGIRGWETGNFTTKGGSAFRAIGAGQSPRGKRSEELRPNYIVVDDIDHDEDFYNPDRSIKKFKWVSDALFPAMSVKGTKRFIVTGNRISDSGVVAQSAAFADKHYKVNILDSKGQPTWKERYSLSHVNYMLGKISYASGQREYFNNPIQEGLVFRDVQFDKVPALRKFKVLICYTDPSFKESKTNDYKATALVGYKDGKYYVIRAFVEQTTTANMLQWLYELEDMVPPSVACYFYMETNFVQDLVKDKVYELSVQQNRPLHITGDTRKKPNKFARIESSLEPLNSSGKLIFNEKEKKNPHMQRLVEQFKSISPKSRSHDDGPDAVEGAVYILKRKLKSSSIGTTVMGGATRGRNKI